MDSIFGFFGVQRLGSASGCVVPNVGNGDYSEDEYAIFFVFLTSKSSSINLKRFNLWFI